MIQKTAITWLFAGFIVSTLTTLGLSQSPAPRSSTKTTTHPKKAAATAKPLPAAPAPTPQASPLAALDRDIFRLSEIAGSLALLRSLCAAPDAEEWPKTMQTLLAAEGTSPDRRARLAGAYNHGYRNYAMTYRVCTPSAKEAATRYLRESDKLSRSILTQYGN